MTTPASVQPAPSQEPGQPQPGGTQAGRGAPRMATEFFYPRWVLLAAICSMVVALAGMGIHYYFTVYATCSLGMAQALCSLDVMPGWAQVGLTLLAFVVVLFFAATYGRTLGSERDLANVEGFERLVVRLTEFQRVRVFAWIIVALVALGLIMEVLRGQLDSVTLALGLITLFACGLAAIYHPRRPAAPQGGREDANQAAHERALGNESRFWNVARNTPPFSFIFRTRHD